MAMMATSIASYAQKGLSRKAAEALARKQSSESLQQLRPSAEKAWKEKAVHFENYTAPIEWRIFGDKPADGRSLYISLHGGGGAPAAVNDQQWRNQINLYKPAEGVYVAPRAPTNTWNLWHEDHMDNILDSLIRYAIIMEDVNPNKVYVMGYSAGGDGTFQLAPRMADRWAAAAMMAGHPGDADARNLRNLPFAIFMGGRDAAYNRNGLAVIWRAKLDSLQQLDPKGFVHDVHIYADKPHWMDRNDTIAIPWMAQFRRNAAPAKVLWVQDDRVESRFYWLQVPASAMKQGTIAEVSIAGNEINILQNSCQELYINLNDQLVDLNKKVIVKLDGRVVFNGKLKRSASIIQQTVKEYQDAVMVYSARLIVNGQSVKSAL